jgi:5-methylcytosine-specific restriction protein A
MLRDLISKIGSEYLNSKDEVWTQHPLGKYIRSEPKSIFEKVITHSRKHELAYKGSNGERNNWAKVPWCAIFIKSITKGSSKGYYVVYLFDIEMKNVFLSLGQSSTEAGEIVKAYKNMNLKDYLQAKASLMRAKIPEYSDFFSDENIDLKWANSNGSNTLPRGYEYSVALSKKYKISSLPEEEILQKDLNKMVSAYFDLFVRGGRDDVNDIPLPSDPSGPSKQSKGYKNHRSIERNLTSSQVKKIKNDLGYECEVCEKNRADKLTFVDKYGEKGKGCYDLHHKLPLKDLKKPTIYDPDKGDFAVLCVTCHRLIHRMDDPSDFELAKEFIQKKV